MRLDHLLSKEHNTSIRPGYPDQPGGVAGTQVPNVCLFRLLKESWNYWLWLTAVVIPPASTAELASRGTPVVELGGGLFAVHTVGS